ncbi:MAG: HAD-IB family hydrolase [Acidimicrobiales bacterium]|nr:HAD-IB family hydrolase [Acidimicrobiales bacterium]
MNGAAFFDLDRTLLPGASGPVVSDALRTVGLMGDRKIPGESFVFEFFDRIGETLPSMALARTGVRFSAGWDADLVAEAGRLAAAQLVDRLQPFALHLIDEHRAAGRKVVMATTSPSTVCEPLAELLGFDGCIATKYGVTDGALDGTIDGRYVWGIGKLGAVKDWALAHDVDLEQSFAYSDSFFDQPLLGGVGHPVAVNPDPRLRAVARLRGWPITHLDVPPGVPKIAGLEPQDLLLSLSRPEFIRYAKLDISGVEHLPAEGGAIVAANHRSYFDFVAIATALAQAGRPARPLAKKELFDSPLVGPLVAAFGAIPVDRGTGSDAPLEQAAEALAAGEVVVILPQGTIPRGRQFFEPELVGKRGVAQLARMSGAPVVPIGIWGSEHVWPRSARVPAVWNLIDPPKVQVKIGPRVELERTKKSTLPDVARVMTAISAQLPPVGRKRTKPTAEELARTYPPGMTPNQPEADGTGTGGKNKTAKRQDSAPKKPAPKKATPKKSSASKQSKPKKSKKNQDKAAIKKPGKKTGKKSGKKSAKKAPKAKAGS